MDTNSRQDSMLLLSSVNLPGGVQRRKTETDANDMRQFFREGDLVSAEGISILKNKQCNNSLVMVPVIYIHEV